MLCTCCLSFYCRRLSREELRILGRRVQCRWGQTIEELHCLPQFWWYRYFHFRYHIGFHQPHFWSSFQRPHHWQWSLPRCRWWGTFIWAIQWRQWRASSGHWQHQLQEHRSQHRLSVSIARYNPCLLQLLLPRTTCPIRPCLRASLVSTPQYPWEKRVPRFTSWGSISGSFRFCFYIAVSCTPPTASLGRSLVRKSRLRLSSRLTCWEVS